MNILTQKDMRTKPQPIGRGFSSRIAEEMVAGFQLVNSDASQFPTGIYICRHA